MRTAILVMLPICLAGCNVAQRDAATEQPIAIKGGLYSVSFEAGAFGMSMPIDNKNFRTKSVCVRSNEGDRWIFKAVREQITKEPNCQSLDMNRTGNAISGRLSCTMDRREGGGIGSMDYSGTISEDSVDLIGKIKPPSNLGEVSEADQRQIQAMAELMEVRIRMERDGDC
jgi:hypothetical protein